VQEFLSKSPEVLGSAVLFIVCLGAAAWQLRKGFHRGAAVAMVLVLLSGGTLGVQVRKVQKKFEARSAQEELFAHGQMLKDKAESGQAITPDDLRDSEARLGEVTSRARPEEAERARLFHDHMVFLVTRTIPHDLRYRAANTAGDLHIAGLTDVAGLDHRAASLHELQALAADLRTYYRTWPDTVPERMRRAGFTQAEIETETKKNGLRLQFAESNALLVDAFAERLALVTSIFGKWKLDGEKVVFEDEVPEDVVQRFRDSVARIDALASRTDEVIKAYQAAD
jgi:NOL1/NOP2/fmu family ribosome biogenesis protein